MSHQQQITLVTGAARGIGFSVSRLLAKKHHHVILGVRNIDAGNKACDEILKSIDGSKKESLTVLQLDVTAPHTISAAAKEIERALGRIDGLVNNAGIGFDEDVTNVNMENARKTFDVNFFGVIEVTNAMIPLLRKSEMGRIVNVSSIMGSLAEHSDPNSAFIRETTLMSYSASKAALNMYTVQLAAKLAAEAKAAGKKNPIRVNSAHPGWCASYLGNLLGTPPSDTEFGARQIVDTLGNSYKGPTGGFFHNKLQLRW